MAWNAAAMQALVHMVRLLVIVFVVLAVLAAASVAWVGFDLPPVKLVLSHDFPPAGGPTGRVKEIEGVRFVEVGAWHGSSATWIPPVVVGRLADGAVPGTNLRVAAGSIRALPLDRPLPGAES
jgi:hypothetical protein